VPGILVRGSLTGHDAMAHLLAAWSGAARSERVAPLMVAFGPAEAEALNLAARPLWHQIQADAASRGPLAGRSSPLGQWGLMPGEARLDNAEFRQIILGERGYAVGDAVLALRRIGSVRSATQGTVASLHDRSLMVEWQSSPSRSCSEVGPDHAGSLGYGYATTVPYLRSCDAGGRDFTVLGDPLELSARSSGARAAWVTVPGAGLPAFGPAGLAARRRAGVAELATSWPDEEMLERAGPRPLALVGRRRWAEVVVACALGRDIGLSGPDRARRVGDQLVAGTDIAVPGPGRRITGEPLPSWHRAPSPGVPGL